MVLKKIEIDHELNFGELSRRLKEVRLRGFPEIKVYEDSNFWMERFSPEEVKERIFTPQPSIYLPILKRIKIMAEMFSKKGIDIFNLNGGYDYFAFDDLGERTLWTIIPPIVERRPIGINLYGNFDFSGLFSEELKKQVEEKGFKINPELKDLSVDGNSTVWMDTICDGSHRIHHSVRNNLSQRILMIDHTKEGYPYYALPKPYSHVHEEEERIEEKIDKLHILDSPGHKSLYRLFPSGGIHSGDIRSKKV